MSDPVRVLCIGETFEPMLQSSDHPAEGPTVTSLPTPERGLSYLSENDVDCLVSELEPAEADSMDGIEFCRQVRDRDLAVPFVLVVDANETARISDAVAADVTDFQVRSTDSDWVDWLTMRIELATARGAPTGNRAIDAHTPSRIDESASAPAEDHQPASDAFESLLRDNRHHRFIDQIADPVYVLDADGLCVAVNDALLEYTGYESAQLEGEKIDEFIDERGYEQAAKMIQSLYREDEHRGEFEVTIRSADGEIRTGEVHVTVVTDDAGTYAGSVGVVRDMTERTQRIRELGQYEAIVETAPIGLFAVDGDGYLRWHNEEFTNDLGIERDIVGTHFQELVDDGFVPEIILENYVDRVRHLLSSANNDEHIAYEMEWNNTTGERGITEVNMGLLPLEDGEFVGTVHAFRNVTERVQYQEELERQNERLERFATLVSHDLRNPLNVAQGYLDLLEAECESHAVEETRWAVDRMEELIDDLLALARYGRTVADRERIDLDELAAVAWAGVDTADATLEVDLDGTITAHESRVRELFENLFRNAIEHGGPSVTVTVGRVAAADSDGDASSGFFVEDDGDGLPDTEGIFEFGHSTTADGTGFGLGIVAEIADAHGWTVTATDGRAGGARFEIREVTLLEEGPMTG